VTVWKALNKSELITAFLFIALGAYIIAEASEWPYLTKDGPGPGFFPLWTGICMVALAAALVLLQAVHAIKQGAVEKTNWAGSGRVLTGWAGLMVSIALLKPAGFIVSFLLLTFFLVMGVYRRSLVAALTVGLGSSIGFWVLFVKLLKVQLPAGPWGF
jgi:putative tricarboxylic transport membrane protein